ncbi:MAG: F0F1 ATP synthase subunit epsilon [Chthonomonadales bacterium]|nr:F0F1 ATP synthase subunit epsilon [Chthonomonadales bacterium]
MATLHLEIVTPDRVVLDTRVRSVRLPGTMGSFGVLPNHAPLIASLTTGAIKVEHDNGDIEYIAASGGFADVRDNRVTVIADTAERSADIDLARVRAAIERAQAQLAEGGAEAYTQAQETLRRYMNRLKVAQQQEEEAARRH